MQTVVLPPTVSVWHGERYKQFKLIQINNTLCHQDERRRRRRMETGKHLLKGIVGNRKLRQPTESEGTTTKERPERNDQHQSTIHFRFNCFSFQLNFNSRHKTIFHRDGFNRIPARSRIDNEGGNRALGKCSSGGCTRGTDGAQHFPSTTDTDRRPRGCKPETDADDTDWILSQNDSRLGYLPA